jgi:tetratricopeptide (TPR) repeat protein
MLHPAWLLALLFLNRIWLVSAELAPDALPDDAPVLIAPAAEPGESESELIWRKGQEALLKGRTSEAVSLFQRCIKQDPGMARSYLSLAAACLEKNEDEMAALYMARYLQLQPDHVAARGHYAELLLRLKQPVEARQQYERFIADIQDREDVAHERLIHGHSRLVDIAENQEDSYAAHLHRGIGLFWLASQYREKREGKQSTGGQDVLCRAAGELTLARLTKPDEARPCFYLYQVWTRLAQNQPAHRSLCAAEAAALSSYLTPSEHRALELAVRARDAERQRK